MSYDLTDILSSARQQVAREKAEAAAKRAKEQASVAGMLKLIMDLRAELAPLSDAIDDPRIGSWEEWAQDSRGRWYSKTADDAQRRHIREIARQEREAERFSR